MSQADFPDATDTPLMSHFIELRSRFIRMFLAVLLVFLGLVGFSRELYDFISNPLVALLPAEASLIATDVASGFLAPIRLTFFIALFVTVPFILAQIWGFIAPGLYKHEKRAALPLLLSAIALIFVQNTLVGAGIRDKIKVGVSGKVITAFDIAKMMALGADWCNSARGFMFAVGCIQSRSCHTNKCPTGVATQDPARQKALDVPDKSRRVKNYHHNTLKALAEIVGCAGLDHPSQLMPHHIVRRQPDGWIKLLSEHYQFIEHGSLLTGDSGRRVLDDMWKLADPNSFQAMTIADEIVDAENERNRML